ncbi:MAG: type IV toxin-antitoxin system AbiEi family antitoxin domain-containing protein [Candidatus Aminicenantes bacterium]|nr:type IV toxin-antitoxin system AbiEi family antitoxin domain-containing protein [Candidatus Aminicenantes bacterium]
MKNEYLASLLRLEHEVFTFKELLLIWGETDINLTKKRVYRYVKAGKLHMIRKGIYAKDTNYDRMELANKIFTPSYISLETVLTREGIVFQHYDGIFVVSYLSREISCGGQKYIFRKIKDPILTNSLGIEKKNNYFIASRERAFLDTIYLSKNYYFDNLSLIDWNKCFDMISIYKNEAMEKRLNSYHKQAEHA